MITPIHNQVFCIHREFTEVKRGKNTEIIAYEITCLTPKKAESKMVFKFLRGHWGIGNSLHYLRDTAFDEDRW